MHKIVIVSTLFIIFFVKVNKSQLNTSSVCQKLKNATTVFICKRTNLCQYVTEISKSGKVVSCGFEEHTPKICCPEKLPTKLSTSTNKNSNKTVRSTKNSYTTVIKKCQQYAQARYVNIFVRGEYLGAPSRNVSKMDCVASVELIVGGNITKPKEFPHMALIGYNDRLEDASWDCGGTLISERYVLSAAHCKHERDFMIIERIVHPQYKEPLVYNDIALFKLHTDVQFNPYMRPICLYTLDFLPQKFINKAIITGWGYTGTGEQKSDPLLKATINFMNDSECKTIYSNEPKLTAGYDDKSMVCAGDQYFGKDTCGGDSGGPLQIPLPDFQCMWSQVGITSIGSAFCGDKKPAIYTKVYYFIPWIQSIVWP
ncbi:hypothetical protein PGB90_000452 [Kerria lacca]